MLIREAECSSLRLFDPFSQPLDRLDGHIAVIASYFDITILILALDSRGRGYVTTIGSLAGFVVLRDPVKDLQGLTLDNVVRVGVLRVAFRSFSFG